MAPPDRRGSKLTDKGNNKKILLRELPRKVEVDVGVEKDYQLQTRRE